MTERLAKGYLQVYTGNGKGKTTAAVGLSIRALGNGLKIYFVQFMKDYPYGEVKILESFAPDLILRRYGNDSFVFEKKQPSTKLKRIVRQGLEEAEQAMLSGKYDLVVLDEVLVSIYFGLFSTEEILSFIRKRPPAVELILTGRYCPQSIKKISDLVTEMKEVKHYYKQGVKARKGIES